MKYLKIKDNVDLKELEKYLIKLNIIENRQSIINNVYCLIDKDDQSFIENNCIDSCFVNCYFNDKKTLDFCNYSESILWDLVIKLVYDLTRQGIVECVEDE